TAATFRTRRRPRGSVTLMRSPARTRLAGFAASSLMSTLPPSHAVEARLRVLNTRAAQSHLSTRIESGEACTRRRYHSRKGASDDDTARGAGVLTRIHGRRVGGRRRHRRLEEPETRGPGCSGGLAGRPELGLAAVRHDDRGERGPSGP